MPPFERYYSDRTSLNAFDTASIISVEQWKTLVRMPWGILSLGMKDFPVGTGATLAKNTRASAFLLVIPYGPLQGYAQHLDESDANDGGMEHLP